MSKPMASRVVGIGPTWLDRRQMGFKNPLGTNSHIYEQMYSNILPCGCWDHTLNNMYTSVHGGVFSLEFSPEGSLLVAACEKRSVLMFDPLTHKRIHTVENAHQGCVNCVRFLDSRSFATCSDDFTVALWDARNLKQKVRSLKGHSNWVKNIEYSPQDGLLVTSGFDGSILTWEMNKYREDGVVYNKVFSTNGLMRTRLTPDATKMIICTTGGYLIIIHNLDLNTLSQDLDGFKPNMYRLMQLSQTILPIASDFTHLFRGQGKRNRVQFITDFPDGDDAEVVSSLQIHPDGHSAISRNVSNNEKSEWSCIHNIEERWSSSESECTDDEDEDSDGCKTISWPGTSTSISTTPEYIIQHTLVQNERRSSVSRNDAGTSTEQRDLSVSPSDVWEALVAIQEARIRRETDRMTSEMSVGHHMFRRQAVDAEIQVRPLNSDSQIFVTRILPNVMSSSSDNEERTHGSVNSAAPVLRRGNASVNTSEINSTGNGRQRRYWSSVSRDSRRKFRKKLPVRQRYASLYRRSLVGQYDRTSVLRKPIYNSRVNEFKMKKLKGNVKLNTNYEMNETQRLENESNEYRYPVNFNERPGGSAVPEPESGAPYARPRTNPILRKSLSRTRGDSETDTETRTVRAIRRSPTVVNAAAISSLRQDLSSFENNLNSFRETISNLEGSIQLNTTCDALGRGENILQSVNESNGREETRNGNGAIGEIESEIEVGEADRSPTGSESREGREELPTRTGTEENPGERVDEANEMVDHEEVVEAGNAGSAPESQLRSEYSSQWVLRIGRRSSASSPSRSETVPPEQLSNGERTILMGVFRAGNEDGIRGTSMRRHNIAAVTVSSPPQTVTNSSADRRDCGRNKSRNNNNSKNNNSNGATKHYPVVPINKKIHQNTKRLTHYVEEPNLGRGFIKELCVSPDGRIICSPFGNGIRLLSFSPTVQDIFHCYPRSPPIPLHELTLNIAHKDIVVSTKFSPYHNLLEVGHVSRSM